MRNIVELTTRLKSLANNTWSARGFYMGNVIEKNTLLIKAKLIGMSAKSTAKGEVFICPDNKEIKKLDADLKRFHWVFKWFPPQGKMRQKRKYVCHISLSASKNSMQLQQYEKLCVPTIYYPTEALENTMRLPVSLMQIHHHEKLWAPLWTINQKLPKLSRVRYVPTKMESSASMMWSRSEVLMLRHSFSIQHDAFHWRLRWNSWAQIASSRCVKRLLDIFIPTWTHYICARSTSISSLLAISYAVCWRHQPATRFTLRNA